MLVITVPAVEYFDEASNTFGKTDEAVIRMEHSLASLSKWEEIYERAFLGKQEKTSKEILTYIRLMCEDDNISEEVFDRFSNDDFVKINEYINAKKTAVWFPEESGPGSAPSRETVTSELIYYWMIAHQVPFECQHWHLNKLLALIKVCNKKNQPAKKRSASEIAAERRRLNDERRAAHATSG